MELERRIPVQAGARLTLVEMAGDVAVVGWDEAEVLVRVRGGREEDLTVQESAEGPVVSARAPCEVRMPAALPLTVRQALANLRVKGLEASLNAEQVRGNLKLDDVQEAVVAEVYGNLKVRDLASLRLVGTVFGHVGLKAVQEADLQNVRGSLRAKSVTRLRASRINGNLHAQEIGGPLQADRVGGNAALKSVAGVVTLDQVAGNLAARDLVAGARVARVGGNLALNGELGAGCTYHFQVGGNAALRLPEEAGAHLTLSAGGRLVSSVRLTDEVRTGNVLSGVLGDGGAEIAVQAGGNIAVSGGAPALGADMGEEIARQVEESLRALDLEAIGQQVGEEMEAAMSRLRVKMESVDWDLIGRRAQRAVERAMERIQRDMDRLVQKAARRQERWQRVAAKEARRQARRPPPHRPPPPAQEAGVEPVGPEPSLDEERLSILQMVERGQITPEEAEMLLDALR